MIETKGDLFFFIEPGTYFIRCVNPVLPPAWVLERRWPDRILDGAGRPLRTWVRPLQECLLVSGKVAHMLYVAIAGHRYGEFPPIICPEQARMARVWLSLPEVEDVLVDAMKFASWRAVQQGFPTALYPRFGVAEAVIMVVEL